MGESEEKGRQFSYKVAVGVFILAFVLVAAHFVYHFTRPERLDNDVQKRMHSIVTDEMSFKRIPGAVVGVWVDGKEPWIVAEGYTNLERKQKAAASDEFRIGSITKTFVATVVLQLVDEKRVSLDRPISAYLGGIPGGDTITVRQLLNQTSGLNDFLYDEEFERASNEGPGRQWKPEELVAIAAARGPVSSPGQAWAYSNTNYVILGMLIEKVTGHGLADEIAGRISRPLGLRSTYYPRGVEMTGRHSEGYGDMEGDSALEDVSEFNPSVGGASSAMVSDLFDLKVWADALTRGSLLSPRTQAERLRWVRCGDTRDFYYGLGIDRIGPFMGHQGTAFGYNCSVYRWPEKKTTIVVLLNMTARNYDSANKILFQIADVLYPGMVPVSY